MTRFSLSDGESILADGAGRVEQPCDQVKSLEDPDAAIQVTLYLPRHARGQAASRSLRQVAAAPVSILK